MGRERRRWTSGEDALLREAIRKANKEGRPLLWRELAKSVPGRTNKDCRRRWCNILADGTTKGSWTESEDERLSHAVRENGPKWTQVAAAVGTRNSDQCSSHWSLSLNPDIDYSDWIRVEDEKLIQAVREHGTNWTMIAATSLPNRTTLALKNRYAALRTKVSQMQGIGKSRHESDARGSRAHVNSRCDRFSANAADPVHLRAQEAYDQSEDEEDEEGDDDDDGKGLDGEDRADFDDEMHERIAPLDPENQGHSPANAAGIRPSSQPTNQAVPYLPPGTNTIEQNLNPILLSAGQWQERLQSPFTYPTSFPPDTASHIYQDDGSFTSPFADMELDFGAFHDFGEPSCPQQPTCYPGLPQQANVAGNFPTSNAMSDVVMSGLNHGIPTDEILPKLKSNDQPTQSYRQGSRRESSRQPTSEPLEVQDLAKEGPVSPETYTQACSILSPSGSPRMQNPFASISKGLQSPLHRVSVDAECTPDELGNLMRTLVGATRKVTVKVLS
ncbi:MAG: hypothetical protein L6R35_003413 [Caloplaca aegaea]|nr:MAG: hypothetical protein L6R35_003413 [Caloplaca aegaea]